MLRDSSQLHLKHYCLTLFVVLIGVQVWSAFYTIEFWYPYKTGMEWGVYCGEGVGVWWDDASTKAQPYLSIQQSSRYPYDWRFAFHFEKANGIVYLPMWSILALLGFATARLWLTNRKTPEFVCPECGYALGGLGERKRSLPMQFVRGAHCSTRTPVNCPECGAKTPRVWRGRPPPA